MKNCGGSGMNDSFYDRTGLRPVINVSGTMTSLGASLVTPEAREAVAEILPLFVEIGDLQRSASAVIARACGTEAGFVTASAAAGITLAIAGCMTGASLAAIERLPDARGLKREVAVQTGHLCHYGAPIGQSVRLAGAEVVPVGQSTYAVDQQLEGAIGPGTCAALYVVSHHVVRYGLIPLERFAAIAHHHRVPVVVDAASEYDLRGFVEKGADIVVYSAHKFLGGPTAGIVAGSKELVRATFLQNAGIGRGMKVGKEGHLRSHGRARSVGQARPRGGEEARASGPGAVAEGPGRQAGRARGDRARPHGQPPRSPPGLG